MKTPPPNTTKQITSINGVAIVAREPALGPHPRWPERQSSYQGVSKVLLEDDTEATICDDCGYVGEDTRNVVSHRNGTHNRVAPPSKQYSDEVLRALIREVERNRRASGNNVKYDGEKVATIMNALGHTMSNGRPWNPEGVSRIYRQYRDRIRVRLSGGKLVPPPPASNGAGPSEVLGLGLSNKQRVDFVVTMLEQALAEARKLQRDEPDPQLVDKAARWDQMQALMQRPVD